MRYSRIPEGVRFRTKPLASDSYKKYPCDGPGCDQKVVGHRTQDGWFSAFKVRQKSLDEFGMCLCYWCRQEVKGESQFDYTDDPEMQARVEAVKEAVRKRGKFNVTPTCE